MSADLRTEIVDTISRLTDLANQIADGSHDCDLSEKDEKIATRILEHTLTAEVLLKILCKRRAN